MWGQCNSPYGICSLQWSDDGAIERLYFAHVESFEGQRNDQQAAALAEQIFADRPIKIRLRGSELELAVWEQLRVIPRGQTRTYQQIATAISRPRAVRAVASAIGRNEISYLVACHRVIRTDGGLGGYRWGLPIKEKILFNEQNIKQV